ncbi:GSK3-beta interaction protein [Drosophila grimshawi]|uniref:GH16900 n=1 Tax=Drosophila grimshawi TaxID=7222 RepID=B4IXM7_DROGR|nr:GSK3-beta interaction protein [Drosophila grimshawi]EDV97489.1 GH16900 [Drosophila grimshawi]
MQDADEQTFNCIDEANAIINDVKGHVAEIVMSTKLESSATQIYLNIRTIESATCCVQVTNRGFKIVSSLYDTIDEDKAVKSLLRENGEAEEDDEIFETPYALLDKISPRYVESFGNKLCQQLRQLQQMRTEFHEEDEEEEDEEN